MHSPATRVWLYPIHSIVQSFSGKPGLFYSKGKCSDMNSENIVFVMMPKEEWEHVKLTMRDVLERLQQLSNSATVAPVSNYITAKEFMDAVKIKRTKFDQLVAENKVQILKKGRKIYLEQKEVVRYFCDPEI